MINSRFIFVPLTLGLATLPSVVVAQTAFDAEQAVQPINPLKLDIARQIVDIGFPEESREEIFFATMDQMTAQMRESTIAAYGLENEELLGVLDNWLLEYVADSKNILRSHIPSIMEGMAKAYANIFTHEELDDILAFVSTASGKRFLQLSPAVIGEPNFATANQAYMNEVQAQLPTAIADLKARIMEAIEATSLEEDSTSS